MSKRAVILAGGQGKRLRPYTVVLPKPLLPLGDRPILEIIIRQLAAHGFTHVTLAVNHQADVIRAFFGNGEKWHIHVDYSIEQEPLSTMGPLNLISDLPENFLVMNGDILTDLNYSGFYDSHVNERSIFTVSGYRREQKSDYGVLEIGSDGFLCNFKEKPSTCIDVSMGIYMANKKIMEFIPKGKPYGFDNLMYDLIEANVPAAVRMFAGYWLDIGRPDDYMKAVEDFQNRKEFLIGGMV